MENKEERKKIKEEIIKLKEKRRIISEEFIYEFFISSLEKEEILTWD